MHEHWYREAAIPIYGLPPSYGGPRMIGDSQREYRDDHDGRGRQLVGWQSLGLVHGNPVSGADPALQVITATMPGPTAIDLLRAEGLRPRSDADPESTSPVHTTVLVDSTPVDFDGIESGSCWVVQAQIGQHMVSAVGVHWPRDGLELVRIEDPEPYISGRTDASHERLDQVAEHGQRGIGVAPQARRDHRIVIAVAACVPVAALDDVDAEGESDGRAAALTLEVLHDLAGIDPRRLHELLLTMDVTVRWRPPPTERGPCRLAGHAKARRLGQAPELGRLKPHKRRRSPPVGPATPVVLDQGGPPVHPRAFSLRPSAAGQATGSRSFRSGQGRRGRTLGGEPGGITNEQGEVEVHRRVDGHLP